MKSEPGPAATGSRLAISIIWSVETRSLSLPVLTSRPVEADAQKLSLIPEYREKVTGRSGDDKQMSREVGVSHSVCRVEPDAGGIGNATSYQPRQTRKRHDSQDLRCG